MKLTQFLFNSPLIWELDSHDLEEAIETESVEIDPIIGLTQL